MTAASTGAAGSGPSRRRSKHGFWPLPVPKKCNFTSPRLGLFSFQILQIFRLVLRNRSHVGTAQQPANHASCGGRVLNAPRKIATEVLGGAFETFIGEIAEHEFG